jgi:hypothetical protein
MKNGLELDRVISKAGELRSKGLSFREIAKQLDSQGMRSPRGKKLTHAYLNILLKKRRPVEPPPHANRQASRQIRGGFREVHSLFQRAG